MGINPLTSYLEERGDCLAKAQNRLLLDQINTSGQTFLPIQIYPEHEHEKYYVDIEFENTVFQWEIL